MFAAWRQPRAVLWATAGVATLGFLVALESDVSDIQGGTTQEGIHMGVMSGTLDLVQRSYAGTHIQGDVLSFRPRLPPQLQRLRFAMQFRGTPIQVEFSDSSLTVSSHPEGASRPIKVGVGEELHELCPGDACRFALDQEHDLVRG